MINKFARCGLENVTPYSPGKPIEEVQREYGLTDIAKLASNENPMGTSPLAIRAMQAEAENVYMYPEGSSLELRQKLAAKFGVSPDLIVVTNGADHFLTMLSMAFINDGDECIMPDPSFSPYITNTIIMGGKYLEIPLKKDLSLDLEATAKAITPKTKLIYICNPNNPTGTIIGKAELEAFMAKVPDSCILVMDEAYAEFVSDPSYPQTIDYVKAGKNVILIRTFSKLYGLAGARVGYAVMPSHLMDAVNRVVMPFPVNRIAQAGALAAMDDDDFVNKTLANNKQAREYLCAEFDKMGMEYAQAHGNFIFVNVNMDSKVTFQSLLEQGMIVRPGHLWGCPTHLRVTFGTMEENQKLIKLLSKLNANKK